MRSFLACIGLLACCLLGLAAPTQAQQAAQAGQAELAVSDWSRQDLKAWWAGLRAIDGAQGDLPVHLQPPSDPKAWKPVRLPDVQETPRAGTEEQPAYQMRWYRLRYEPEHERWPTSLALYMPRLVTLAAAVLVRTDQGWRPVFDNQNGAREQWVRPLWVVLPAALSDLHKGKAIELVVAAPVYTGSLFAVSSVRLGPRDELEPAYNWRWGLQIGVPLATGMTLVVLGAFAFSLWLKRRDEPAYLLFALACLAWLFRNLHYSLDMPSTKLALDWFWWATHASMAWVMLLIFMFALRFAHRRFARFELGLGAFVLASSLLSVPVMGRLYDSVVVLHLANAVVGVLGTAFVVRVAWREGSAELRWISLSLMAGLVLGLHDLGMLAGWWGAEHIYLMPFSTLIVLASFLYAVQCRYVGALRQNEFANEQLAQRLVAQGTALQSQHDRLRESERQQALLVERQRLMQDMHDGLGSSLLSAMVAVGQGTMEQDQVVEVLRECVDDLRLVIDSLEPVGHDLVSLLATMRYRLGKRLQAGGLKLEWDVHDLPQLDWLEPPDALHVLRLMQEALNNALKHARATRVRIVTRDLGSKIEIRVEDDGEGFDIETVQRGRGLRGLQKRAKHLGGSLRVESSPGHGTVMTLRLPVNRDSREPLDDPPSA